MWCINMYMSIFYFTDVVHLVSDAFTPAAEVEEPEITGISSLHNVDFLALSDLGEMWKPFYAAVK